MAIFSGGGGGDTLPIVDTTAVVKGSADATKLVRIEADSITTGTTRVMTMPDEDITLVGAATTDTFTNKTFDANGTGNSLSNVDVADLANGTDGELITWDAAGAPTTVAAGTSGQVLTSNGAGAAPTFQAAAGGGGISNFDATVGASGADYTHVGAAVDDSKSRILVIDDTTEDADIAIPAAGLYIYIRHGFNVNMAGFQFTYAGARQVCVEGEGFESKITYANTTDSVALFDMSAHITSELTMKNLQFDNSATTQFEGAISDDGVVKATNVKILAGNANSTTIVGADEGTFVDGLWVVGGGSSCGFLFGASKGNWSNLYFSGTFKNSTDFDLSAFEAVATNIISDSTMQAALYRVTNWEQNGGNLTPIFASNSQCSNINFGGGEIDLTSDDDCLLSNCRTTGNCDINNGSDSNHFTNMRVGGTTALDADYNTFDNCEFVGLVTVGTGAVRNRFTNCTFIAGVSEQGDQNFYVNCRFGADAGGGAATITITADANDCHVLGCSSDAAISDSGTTTVTANNFVY